MHQLIPVTVLSAALVVAAATGPASAAENHQKMLEGSDRGSFTAAPLDDVHVLTQDHATGAARHVGHYTLDASEVINLATLEVTEGGYTMAAADGALTGSYSGAASATTDPNVITYHVAGPVLRGSGRFAAVSGWLIFDGVANLATGELCDRVSGWISTPADAVDRQRSSSMSPIRTTTGCRL